MNLQSAVRTAQSVITANSPVLLVGTAIAGVVATGILAAKGGYRARGIVEEALEEKGEELTTQEKIALTWLCYAPPILTGASAIAATVGVHSIHTKRHAALAGLYAVTSTQLDDYREKAEELLGTKKTQELNDAVAQKQIDRQPFVDNELVIVGDNTEICYDAWSGRYFTSTLPKIEAALLTLNHELRESDQSLNDFFDNLGLRPIDMGNRFGWNAGTKVEMIPNQASMTPDGRSALMVSFRAAPKDFISGR